MLQHDVTPGPPLSDLDFRAARSTGNLPHEHHEPTLPTPGVCQSAQRQRPDQHKCQQPRRILITWHESGGVLAVLTVLASSVAPFERALLARSSGACVADYYSAVSVSHEACSPVGSFEPAAATASPRRGRRLRVPQVSCHPNGLRDDGANQSPSRPSGRRHDGGLLSCRKQGTVDSLPLHRRGRAARDP